MKEKPIVCSLEEIGDNENKIVLNKELPAEYLWEGKTFLDVAEYMTNEQIYKHENSELEHSMQYQATHLKDVINETLDSDNKDSSIMFWNKNDDPDVNKGPFNYNEAIGDYSRDLIKLETNNLDGEDVKYKHMDLQIRCEIGGAAHAGLEYTVEDEYNHIR